MPQRFSRKLSRLTKSFLELQRCLKSYLEAEGVALQDVVKVSLHVGVDHFLEAEASSEMGVIAQMRAVRASRTQIHWGGKFHVEVKGCKKSVKSKR